MSVFSSQSSLSSQPSQVQTVIMAVKRIKIRFVDCRFLLSVSLACMQHLLKGLGHEFYIFILVLGGLKMLKPFVHVHKVLT